MAFNYNRVLTPELKKHVDGNVDASKYEGNDFVRIDTAGQISRFTDSMTPEQYRRFDWNRAEIVILNYASKVFNSTKHDSSYPESKGKKRRTGMSARRLY